MIRWTTFGTLPIKISYFSVQSLQKEKLQYTSLITTDSFFSLRFLMKNNRFETNKENTRVKPYYIMHVDCLKCGFFSWVNCIYKYGEFGVRINSEPKTITTINTFKDKKNHPTIALIGNCG